MATPALLLPYTLLQEIANALGGQFINLCLRAKMPSLIFDTSYKAYPKKVFGLSIGFVLPSKGTGASYYRKIVLRGMYRVAALRL
jgi:hypothetical protein